MNRRPTIRDVARRASLSISTVSLVLNDKPHVTDSTREKVRRAIADLGYRPQQNARNLASRASGNIGFILTEDHFSQAEPFYTRIFLGTEFEARNHNYYILLTTIGHRFRKQAAVPRFLLDRNVDGVIIAGRIHEKFIEYVEKLGLPVVLVDYCCRQFRHSCVLIDNFRGAQAAVNHLIAGGHRAIGFIGGDISHPSLEARYQSYCETLQENGITFDPSLAVVDEKDSRIHNGYNATERLLRGAKKPSAIFAANDAMAIGCMRYLNAAGLTIPRDMAVVGFDDIEMSSHVVPRLTTVRVHKEEMGKLAVRRIVEMIKSKTNSVVTIHVPVELIVRESCGIPSPFVSKTEPALHD